MAFAAEALEKISHRRIEEKPSIGSDVQFKWNHKGESTITKVIKNLLEN